MWPEVPVRTKVRVLPYFVLMVVGLGVLEDGGYIDLSAQAQTVKSTHRHVNKSPSRAARADIPARYLRLYRSAGVRYRVPWPVLAAIGKVESDHGRSSAPGVRSGVNRFGCCAGPMQFNLRNGPPSTWDTYGRGSVYRPEDAIPAAARKLAADGARRNLPGALYSYNHSRAYVARVRALARRYQKGA